MLGYNFDELFINPISFGRAGGIYQELGVSPTANLLTKNNPLNLLNCGIERYKMKTITTSLNVEGIEFKLTFNNGEFFF